MKDNIRRQRQQATDQDIIFAKDTFNKRLMLKIYKKLLTLNKNKFILKKKQYENGPKIITETSPKWKHKWQIHV